MSARIQLGDATSGVRTENLLAVCRAMASSNHRPHPIGGGVDESACRCAHCGDVLRRFYHERGR